jgi:hypothetical protein
MRITAKIGNMRKAVQWTVYPAKKDGRIVIQSSSYIAVFDATGNGLLSARQSGGAYFLHLSPACGAKPVQVTRDVVEAALAAQPQKGDHIGFGVFVG